MQCKKFHIRKNTEQKEEENLYPSSHIDEQQKFYRELLYGKKCFLCQSMLMYMQVLLKLVFTFIELSEVSHA